MLAYFLNKNNPHTASLPLPDISIALVEKATLGARNIAPGADELPTSILKIA
jgi:hypothetical protein